MPPDRERGPARHRPSTINPHPAATPGEFGRNGSELILRWAAAAINRELRRQREGES